MLGTDQLIVTTTAGEIFATAASRRFHVIDNQGHSVSGPGPVDMATAFRVLDGMLKMDGGAGAAGSRGMMAAR